jgi:hypothetical protein
VIRARIATKVAVTKMSSALTILQAIKAKDWHAANEAFARVINQKIADRLVQERQVAFNESARDDAEREVDQQMTSIGITAPNPEKEHKFQAGSKGLNAKVPRSMYCKICGGSASDHRLGESLADERSEGDAIRDDDAANAELKESLIVGNTMPKSEIERVFREVGDAEETALLCGVPVSALAGLTEVSNYTGSGAGAWTAGIWSKCNKCEKTADWRAKDKYGATVAAACKAHKDEVRGALYAKGK